MLFRLIAILFFATPVVRGGIDKLPPYCKYYTTLTPFGSSRRRVERPSNTEAPTMEEEVTIVEVTDVNEEVEVSLPDVIEATFEPNTFNASTTVTVREVTEKAPEVNDLFSEMTQMHRTATQGNETIRSEEIYIEIPGQVPLTDFVAISVNIPDDLSAILAVLTETGQDFGFQLFVLCQHGGAQEEPYSIFILLPSVYDEMANALDTEIPSACFNPNPFDPDENVYVAILSMSLTPGSNVVAQRRLQDCPNDGGGGGDDECEAVSIDCPLERGCEVTSPYIPAGGHEETGGEIPHYGVDLRANTGDNVTAAADGTIELTDTTDSFGKYIILRHADLSATLYAHLDSILTTTGTTVRARDVIGTAGSTGLSLAPHLHFEYVPNGEIIASPFRIDPYPCIGTLLEGSITVADTGNLADDAFEVFVDGFSIGRTEIGASNSLAVNNLRPGQHTLVLVTIIAPDDIGTYTITLRDGWTFEDGSQFKDFRGDPLGYPIEGESRTWTFIVC